MVAPLQLELQILGTNPQSPATGALFQDGGNFCFSRPVCLLWLFVHNSSHVSLLVVFPIVWCSSPGSGNLTKKSPKQMIPQGRIVFVEHQKLGCH